MFRNPVGLVPGKLRIPPDHGIGGVLRVDDSREVPSPKLSPIHVRPQVLRNIDKTNVATVGNNGGDLGAASVTHLGELGMHGGEGGGSDPQCTVGLGQNIDDP